MISVDQAKSAISKLIGVVGTENIPLAEANGRVLRSPVFARRDQPPFAASAMDGYAVRSSDLTAGGKLSVVGEIAAGHGSALAVSDGQAVRVFTGAPLPEGADHVLIQENATRTGNTIEVHDDFNTTAFVRPAGTDFKNGFEFAAPKKLNSLDIALLASMGCASVEVARKPTVAIIPTGDELVWPGETPRADQISASNNFGLKAMLEEEGALVQLLPIARDSLKSLNATLDLSVHADIVLTLGGASVGDHDLIKDVTQDRGLDLAFYKIAMRPGKPLLAGKIDGKPLIGLPGNPVSSMVCGHIFLRPAINACLGLGFTSAPLLTAKLTTAMDENGPREHYLRAAVFQSEEGWMCTPKESQDSSLLSVLSSSNALLVRPPNQKALVEGSVVKFTHI